MKQHINYTLGLDIGMASVGAALLAEEKILALYVRAFNKAEQPDSGESLGKVRRDARLVRRRLRRRAFRLLRLRRLLKREGLIANQELPVATMCAWQLRAEALDRQLSDHEFAQVIYHIIKHRGFQSNRKSELKDDEKLGQMLAGVGGNQELLKSLQGSGVRSVGEMAYLQHGEFKQAKRNKAGAYLRTFARTDLQQELRLIFAQQQTFAQLHAGPDFFQACEKLLLARQPTLSGENLLKMVGKCSFETNEFRAPKASFRAEQFVWLTKLNNLRITGLGDKREPSSQERLIAFNLPFELSKLTYKQLRKKWNLSAEERFAGLSYRHDGKDPEDALIFEAKGYHAMKKAYEGAGAIDDWQRARLDADCLDQLAYALTCFKDDTESRQYLLAKGFAENVIEEAIKVSFADFIRLSQTALRKILPFMIDGQRYDQAVQAAGYTHHSDLTSDAPKQTRLPKFTREQFPNPVVYRALNQARKVVNAIIDHYGPPSAVHIELARDLARPYDERKKIQKLQDDFRAEKEKAVQSFQQTFGMIPRAKEQDLLKVRLYHEQDGQCAYSQQGLELHRLFEAGYAEIDHALPYARSFDDSQNNKVLVLLDKNRNKGNRTPCEYLDGPDSAAWGKFVAWVNANKKLRQAKKQRLLRLHFGSEESQEFTARNLNDTRYVCRAFKTMVEMHLQLTPIDEGGKPRERCVVLSGQLTAMLRARWGLIKVRESGDLHHALDAAVIAACSQRMVQQVGYWARVGKLNKLRDAYVDPNTGEVVQPTGKSGDFPLPWPHFRQELKARLSENPAQALAGLPGYGPAPQIDAVRVSRAPLRRGLGEAHQDTIRSLKCGKDDKGKQLSAIKTPLTELNEKKLASMVGYEDPRNQELVEALRERLRQFKDDGKKAFAQPFYKPCLPGREENAPLVRSVKLLAQVSGIAVRGGIAKNGSMLRVDIFTKNQQFFAVPLYVADVNKRELPMRAVVQGKAESDWLLMDESYQFCFSLHTNDWVVVRYGKNKPSKEGYFGGFDRATGNIDLWVHDRDRSIGKDGLLRGIGIKTLAAIEKYHVDVLGSLYRARAETRQPLKHSRG